MSRFGPAWLAVVLVAAAACDGARSSETNEVTPMSFTLTSNAFEEGGAIPSAHTCQGADSSPSLAWSGAPDGTVAFALIVDDPDANDWVHWLIYDIPGNVSSLAEGASRSASAPQGQTTWGTTGYRGPCPPSGTHRYRFRLLALSAKLGLAAGQDVDAVTSNASGLTLGEATLTGTYRKG